MLSVYYWSAVKYIEVVLPMVDAAEQHAERHEAGTGHALAQL